MFLLCREGVLSAVVIYMGEDENLRAFGWTKKLFGLEGVKEIVLMSKQKKDRR